ncbi:MAG: hypothetical protein Rhirs2KO_04260 [Rhizobiaceae bacterium]
MRASGLAIEVLTLASTASEEMAQIIDVRITEFILGEVMGSALLSRPSAPKIE